MIWEELLSLKRFGDSHKRLRKEQDDTRLGFEVDYDRVIFSSAFRSLQDKTQVVPLSKTDFVHTRLTHSLEVSVVGRSIGRKVGQKLLQKYPHLSSVHGYHFNDFGAIVAAAAGDDATITVSIDGVNYFSPGTVAGTAVVLGCDDGGVLVITDHVKYVKIVTAQVAATETVSFHVSCVSE